MGIVTVRIGIHRHFARHGPVEVAVKRRCSVVLVRRDVFARPDVHNIVVEVKAVGDVGPRRVAAAVARLHGTVRVLQACPRHDVVGGGVVEVVAVACGVKGVNKTSGGVILTI